jgi:lysyl-tRNA synthetase class 2
MTDDDAMQFYEDEIQPKLIKPTFVTHLPSSHIPLCAPSEDKRFAEGFELIWNGLEIGPGYTELNDPFEQVANFVKQKGQDIADIDKDFIDALKVGMPPAGGFGLGIDRLCMVLLKQQSVKDVILFPLQRPQKDTM